MIVTLVGGPEDGRDVNVPAARPEELPPIINVAAQRERPTAREFADGPPYLVHSYRRERTTRPGAGSWAYVYEGTTS